MLSISVVPKKFLAKGNQMKLETNCFYKKFSSCKSRKYSTTQDNDLEELSKIEKKLKEIEKQKSVLQARQSELMTLEHSNTLFKLENEKEQMRKEFEKELKSLTERSSEFERKYNKAIEKEADMKVELERKIRMMIVDLRIIAEEWEKNFQNPDEE